MRNMINKATDALLDEHIEAARQVDEAALAAATQAFRQQLPEVHHSQRGVPAWLRLAGVMAALVLAISLIPMLLPGKPGANAFAQAQAWFEQYRTLQFEMITRHRDQGLTTMRVWSDESGNTRIETPPVIQWVLPSENVMHTLLPGGQVMSRALSPVPELLDGENGMDWLDELVTFQGLAEPLTDAREIDGIQALGWRLALSGGTHTLWVDPSDHRPLLLEAVLPGDLQMTSTFVFDEPLPEDWLELPPSSITP